MTHKDKAARSAKRWSERAKDLADKGSATARNRAEPVMSNAGPKISEHSGKDNLYGRVAAVLDLSDEQATVRLESFVTAFVRAVRQEDKENLSQRDVITAAKRRQRLIGTALWELRRSPGKAVDAAPGSANLRDVLLPTTRVKQVFTRSEQQLGVR